MEAPERLPDGLDEAQIQAPCPAQDARGSRKRGQAARHIVGALVCSHGIVLGQWKTDEKSNEIMAVPELIEALDLEGATVTLDAMGCQKAIAQALVDKGADDVFGLKGNQGTRHEQVERLFDVTEWLHYEDFADWGHVEQGAGHGRIETRRCVALACPAGGTFDPWAGMKSVVMLEAMRETVEDVTADQSYFVSSLPPDSQRLGTTIDRHWEVRFPLFFVFQ